MDREITGEKLEPLRHRADQARKKSCTGRARGKNCAGRVHEKSCIGRVCEKRPATPDAFLHDYDLQDIVAINLTRAVQLCVDVGAHIIAGGERPAPDTMSETFDAMAQTGILGRNLADRMKKAVGFRNVAVHSYRSIDWAIVHAICQNHLDDFGDFATAVVSHMERK